MCQEVIKGVHTREVGTEKLVNIGIIKLIPIGVKQGLVGGWWSITLLNVTYKIRVKALAMWTLLLVARIVHKEQTGFINGKFILFNLVKRS
jgi:hypothetical protein